MFCVNLKIKNLPLLMVSAKPSLYYYQIFLVLLIFFSPLAAFSQKNTGDSITIAVAPEYDKVGKIHRFLFGENYRKLWAVPVKMKVFHLQNEKGGLTILQQGGGMQTRSLRLRDKEGHEWVLRSLQKYPERALPPNLRATVAKDILQDQISTSNPFAALTVPLLAGALDIPHSNPEIVYLPDDPALGKYSKDYANGVFLFEEREPLESEDTDNTKKVQKELRDDNDVKVDQKKVLRARLLDMLLGDWDRHDDQWRWDKDKQKKETVYTPIPRDRDQVYYKTSGVFPWIISHQWLKSKFQPYSPSIRDVNGWNFNARYFDRFFLNQLGESDWQEEIKYVQEHLTDGLVSKAMRKMPEDIYNLSGKDIEADFIARRDNLQKLAMEYYEFLSIYVEIPASDKTEKFEIKQQTDGFLDVTIYKIKKDSARNDVIYKRTFKPGVTKEVRMYGFDGEDTFHINGDGRSPIKVRMIGGGDKDGFYVDSNVNNKKNIYVYDRSDKENILPAGSLAKIHTSTDTTVNEYDRKSFVYDRFQPVTLARYNNDYGVSLIGGFILTKQGFRKTPYASRHELLIDYSLVRKSFNISYSGDFKKLIGNNDLNVKVLSMGPNNVSNFFGIGNESVYVDKGKKEIRYYRNNYDHVIADVRLSHTYGSLELSGGVAGQFYYSGEDDNERRFLLEYNQQNPQEHVFSRKGYAGLIAGAELDTRDNVTFPSSGVHWITTLMGQQQISGDHDKYGQLTSQFSFYYRTGKDSSLVIAARVGGGTTIGSADYFQQLKLGGANTLRGFHTWRFTGKSMLYNNLELRAKVLDFNSYLFPGSIGAIAFNDIGRVWSPGEPSAKWHDGYGVGIYIIPAELLLIQASVGFSKESSMKYISIGYRF
jgi:hypothetical protein